MNCPQCAAPLRKDLDSCPTCGSQIPPTAPTEELPPPPASPTLDFPPGAKFAGRYTIIERAGYGGMGVVYKAIDNTLGQTVALKLIRSELADDTVFQDRFKREVLLTRQIAHPNVCRVHDLGESHGLLYLSMEWIEGETLRRFLRQSERVEPTRALAISEAIARALAAAHAEQIVHRDLKPENVMIDKRGSIRVLDFGLAVAPGDLKALGSSGRSGTPDYKSPEQMRGEEVDPRTDLYALGLILREMLTGEHRSAGEPTPHTLPAQFRSEIGPVLIPLLADQREERPASAAAVGETLRRLRDGKPGPWTRQGQLILGSAIIGTLLAAVLIYYVFFPPATVKPPPPPSPGQAFYDSALQTLAQDAETVRSLDAAIHMLHRAVQRDPAFAAAWARLAEAYWIRYSWTREESSREEAKKAVEEAFALEPNLPELLNARARGLIAEGRYRDAATLLETAVKKGPQFDTAWANLGVAYQDLGKYDEGLEAFKEAIALRPDNPKHRINLGRFYYRFQLFEKAVEAQRDALLLKPDSWMALDNLGASLLKMGRTARAIDAFSKSLEIHPEDTFALSNLGTAHYFQGDFSQAEQYYRRATELEPKNADYWGNLGDALIMLERQTEARESYLQAVAHARKRVAMEPRNAYAHSMLGLYCARVRDEECARRQGKLASEIQPDNTEILFRNAVINCILDRSDEALDWLEKAIRLGLSKTVMQNDPDLNHLQEHPRFQTLLELAS